MARRQRTKPNLFVNSKLILKHPWMPTVRLCNPDNTCDAFAREQSAHIFHSPFPYLRTVKIVGRVRTYVATSVEYEICVFRFSQVDWTVRKAVDLAPSRLPYERRGFVHQELSKRFACACKVEEVCRVDVCSNLSPSRLSAKEKRTKKVAYKEQHIEVQLAYFSWLSSSPLLGSRRSAIPPLFLCH